MAHVRMNTLLHTDDVVFGPDETRAALKQLRAQRGSVRSNARAITPQILDEVHRQYGGIGLANLLLLVGLEPENSFPFFLGNSLYLMYIEQSVGAGEPLAVDNAVPPQGPLVDAVYSNIYDPWLSKALYAPGTHPGYIVYGLGSPRILVSHPFFNLVGEVYSVYEHTRPAAIELFTRGYHGATLFVDYLHGLNSRIGDVPRWLAWFSLIAVHSDLVVFIDKDGLGLTEYQLLEAQATPDRVRKILVPLSTEQLKHDDTAALQAAAEITGEVVELDGTNEFEAQHSDLFLRQYIKAVGAAPMPGFRDDVIYQYDKSMNRYHTLPADYPLYN